MEITHPFHPWKGHCFPVESHSKYFGLKNVRLRVEADLLVSVPVAWTGLRQVDSFETVSAGRSLFRFDELISVRILVDELIKNYYPK